MGRLRRRRQELGQAAAEPCRSGIVPVQTGDSRQAPVTGRTADDGSARTGNVQVISGASVQTFPIAGLRLDHARALLSRILRLDPRGPVLVNGRPVSATYRLGVDDTVEFVHEAGVKGAAYGRPDRDH